MILAAGFWLTYGWELIALGILLGFSAFFSGSETALFSLTRTDLAELEGKKHNPLAGAVLRLHGRPRRLLNTLLLGNTLVNIGFSATAAVLVFELEHAGFAPHFVALASVAPLLAVILIGEVTPKLIAVTIAYPWSYLAAWPVTLLEQLLRPILWALETLLVEPITRVVSGRPAESTDITGRELAALMSLSTQHGVVDQDAGTLMREIVELSDLTAGNIMIPRVDMIAHDIHDGPDALRELFRQTRFRKLPVHDGDLDHLLGIVHARRFLLHPETPLEQVLRPIFYIPEAASLERVLEQFRAGRRQMAVVVDEYGGTAGLITLEDVLEEIVGDLHDLNDQKAPPPVEYLGETEYLCHGGLPVHDWAETFDTDHEEVPVSTLGGLVTFLLGRIPRSGDRVAFHNLQLTVRAMQGRRVQSVHVRLREGQP
jgi:CBS domain containing-hemolysin-like protein